MYSFLTYNRLETCHESVHFWSVSLKYIPKQPGGSNSISAPAFHSLGQGDVWVSSVAEAGRHSWKEAERGGLSAPPLYFWRDPRSWNGTAYLQRGSSHSADPLQMFSRIHPKVCCSHPLAYAIFLSGWHSKSSSVRLCCNLSWGSY